MRLFAVANIFFIIKIVTTIIDKDPRIVIPIGLEPSLCKYRLIKAVKKQIAINTNCKVKAFLKILLIL